MEVFESAPKVSPNCASTNLFLGNVRREKKGDAKAGFEFLRILRAMPQVAGGPTVVNEAKEHLYELELPG